MMLYLKEGITRFGPGMIRCHPDVDLFFNKIIVTGKRLSDITDAHAKAYEDGLSDTVQSLTNDKVAIGNRTVLKFSEGGGHQLNLESLYGIAESLVDDRGIDVWAALLHHLSRLQSLNGLMN